MEKQTILIGQQTTVLQALTEQGIISSIFFFLGVGVAALTKKTSVLEKLASFIYAEAGLMARNLLQRLYRKCN